MRMGGKWCEYDPMIKETSFLLLKKQFIDDIANGALSIWPTRTGSSPKTSTK